MRAGLLPLILAFLALSLHALAEQAVPASPAPSTPDTSSSAAEVDALQQRLAASEARNAQLQNAVSERESALNARLRQENQRLQLQLEQAQADAPEPLLSQRQMWFVIGAGTALISVLIGAILRGSRRKRREWIN